MWLVYLLGYSSIQEDFLCNLLFVALFIGGSFVVFERQVVSQFLPIAQSQCHNFTETEMLCARVPY